MLLHNLEKKNLIHPPKWLADANSKLPNVPKEDAIKKLLMESLEAHYGSLTSAVVVNPDIQNVLSDLQKVIERYKQ